MQTLNIDVPGGSYPIYIGDALDRSALLLPYIKDKKIMVVSNTTVHPLYFEQLKLDLTKASEVQCCVLPDGESFKNQNSINLIYDALMQHNFNRDAVIIALGGGVVGDMAGFAAASFQRGVDFIQIPTTLLSQVDSSVGGKTGINHPLGKNMIGAFKQPKCVVIDTNSLRSLPEREVSAGIAEIIKYALIEDEPFLCWLEDNTQPLLKLDMSVVNTAIYKSCEHKANIVSQDEKEAGVRALLNLGHTFGHAIENHMGYGEWLHGEAVGFGMLQAAYMSYLEGNITTDDVNRIRNILEKTKLPIEKPDISVDEAITLMSRDKKVKSGKLRLVLLKSIGSAYITADFSEDNLRDTLTMKTL